MYKKSLLIASLALCSLVDAVSVKDKVAFVEDKLDKGIPDRRALEGYLRHFFSGSSSKQKEALSKQSQEIANYITKTYDELNKGGHTEAAQSFAKKVTGAVTLYSKKRGGVFGRNKSGSTHVGYAASEKTPAATKKGSLLGTLAGAGAGILGTKTADSAHPTPPATASAARRTPAPKSTSTIKQGGAPKTKTRRTQEIKTKRVGPEKKKSTKTASEKTAGKVTHKKTKKETAQKAAAHKKKREEIRERARKLRAASTRK
jgi:hypothetical protein